MEDDIKIQKKLTELGGDWVAVVGYNSLMYTEGDFKLGKNIKFLADKGYPVKIFVNKITGELKIFPAILFEKDEC